MKKILAVVLVCVGLSTTWAQGARGVEGAQKDMQVRALSDGRGVIQPAEPTEVTISPTVIPEGDQFVVQLTESAKHISGPLVSDSSLEVSVFSTDGSKAPGNNLRSLRPKIGEVVSIPGSAVVVVRIFARVSGSIDRRVPSYWVGIKRPLTKLVVELAPLTIRWSPVPKENATSPSRVFFGPDLRSKLEQLKLWSIVFANAHIVFGELAEFNSYKPNGAIFCMDGHRIESLANSSFSLEEEVLPKVEVEKESRGFKISNFGRLTFRNCKDNPVVNSVVQDSTQGPQHVLQSIVNEQLQVALLSDIPTQFLAFPGNYLLEVQDGYGGAPSALKAIQHGNPMWR